MRGSESDAVACPRRPGRTGRRRGRANRARGASGILAISRTTVLAGGAAALLALAAFALAFGSGSSGSVAVVGAAPFGSGSPGASGGAASDPVGIDRVRGRRDRRSRQPPWRLPDARRRARRRPAHRGRRLRAASRRRTGSPGPQPRRSAPRRRPDPGPVARRYGVVGAGSAPPGGSTGATGGGGTAAGPIDLNKATAAELDTLPGHRTGDRGQDPRLARRPAVRRGRRSAHPKARRREDLREPQGSRDGALRWVAADDWRSGRSPRPSPPGRSRRVISAPRSRWRSPRCCSSARRGRGRVSARCCRSSSVPGSSPSGWRSSRPGRRPLDQPPDGDGPWALVVESTGSPRDGAQTATLATPADADRPFRVAATLPRYPVVIPGDRVVVDGAIRARPDSPYGAYLLRIGAAGTLTSRTLDGPAWSRRPGSTSRGAPPRVRRGPGPGPPGARGRSGGRDPDRPAGPGRSRPGGGVHDGRGQSRGRHLGLEHRDRGGGDRGTDGSSRPAATIGRDARRDRRLRRVLRGVGVGRPGGTDGRRRAPRPRDAVARAAPRRRSAGPRRSCSSRTRRSSAMPGSSCRRWRRPG